MRMPKEYTASDRVISERIGDEFVVALAANPSTGYDWEPQFDASVLELLDRHFAAAGPRMGSGAPERFRFKALAPGAGELTMVYRRRGEPAPAQEVVFQLH